MTKKKTTLVFADGKKIYCIRIYNKYFPFLGKMPRDDAFNNFTNEFISKIRFYTLEDLVAKKDTYV